VPDKQVLRTELGWEPDQTTALVVGSKRVRNLESALHILNHSGWPLQVAIVAGGDDELFEQLQKTEWHVPTRLYNYVDNMSDMMLAADFILCKAGGLIVTESLAAGLPMLLVDVTPGQEEGNSQWVLEQGAGDLADEPLCVLEVLSHWMTKDGEILRQRTEAARKLGQPRAAYTIAELIWAAAVRGPRPITEATLKGLPRLIELLSRFGLLGDSTSVINEPRPL
jgi:1,2-diacylglycerol 3-beta-galactosyltransferase